MADKLLPISATEQECAIEQATARLADIALPIRDTWNPMTVQPGLLPWLAWAFCTPAWETGWTVPQKRKATQDSLFVLKHRGTPEALIKGIEAIFPDAEMQEWWQQTPPGIPYTFDLLLEAVDVSLDMSTVTSILAVVQSTKNLRSHLGKISIGVKSHPTETYACGAVVMGTDVTVGDWDSGEPPPPPPDPVPLITDGSWLLDGTESLTGWRA